MVSRSKIFLLQETLKSANVYLQGSSGLDRAGLCLCVVRGSNSLEASRECEGICLRNGVASNDR